MAAGNRYGLKELTSRKTPDTNDIVKEAKAFMLRHNVPPEMVVFDRGGGGKQHADRLRSEGYRVRTVAFGESLVPDPKHGITTVKHRLDQREDHYAFTNRRAEMYGEFRLSVRSHRPSALPWEMVSGCMRDSVFPQEIEGRPTENSSAR
jgi:hypothetical protein